MNEFKDRLKEAMEIRGITSYRIGKDTTINRVSVEQYLRGVQPRYDTVVVLADYLNVNLTWLATGYGVMSCSENINPENTDISIVDRKTSDKFQDRVTIYNVEARMSLVSLYDVGRVEAIGEVSFPNMPKSDAAVIARGDSMYPLIKSGSVVAFRRLHNFDFFVPGEIYIVNFSVNGDNYNVFKYVQTIAGDNEKIRLVSYNPNHGDMVIQKSDVLFMGLVTFWVNISAT